MYNFQKYKFQTILHSKKCSATVVPKVMFILASRFM